MLSLPLLLPRPEQTLVLRLASRPVDETVWALSLAQALAKSFLLEGLPKSESSYS